MDRDATRGVPVHGAVKRMLDGWRDCPSVADLEAAVRRDATWRQRDADFVKVQQKLQALLSVSVASLEAMLPVSDWLLCSEGELGVIPSDKSVDSLRLDTIKLGRWAESAPFVSEASSLMGPLASGVLVHDLVVRLRRLQSRWMSSSNAPLEPAPGVLHPDARLALYFVHGANMMGFLRLIQAFDVLEKGHPPFGAAVSLEVASRPDDSQLIVRLLIENSLTSAAAAVRRPIPLCPLDARGDCPLSSLVSMLAPYTNETFVSRDWEAMCDRDTSALCPISGLGEPQSSLSFVTLWAVAGMLAGVIATVTLLLVAWRWWRNRQHRSRQEIIVELEIN